MKLSLSFFIILSTLIFVGFDFSKHSIPISEIKSGGPPKDGIPALTDPKFVDAADATKLKPNDRVLGIHERGEAKAYPISILNWHELVNDTIAGQEVLISYCPLCGTGMAFDAHIDEKRFLFGVSGKLYNSDVLFYDKQTESLWSQIKMEAVVGKMTGAKLKWLPLEHTTWDAWLAKHPNTKVMSFQTGYQRNYFRNPYAGYESDFAIMFPVSNHDARLSTKTWIVGVIINGQPKAYAFVRFPKSSGILEDRVGNQNIRIHYDKKTRTATVFNLLDEEIPSVQAFWFAWAAFYPKTDLWEPF